jgi:pimeloyl-ACP methyl ester carboxylesterase
MRQDYRPLLREINIPTLLTYGEESNYYPPETSPG